MTIEIGSRVKRGAGLWEGETGRVVGGPNGQGLWIVAPDNIPSWREPWSNPIEIVLMCSGCAAVLGVDMEEKDLSSGGHVIPGSIPDLCGPVEEASPVSCRFCRTEFFVPATRLVPMVETTREIITHKKGPSQLAVTLVRRGERPNPYLDPIVHVCHNGVAQDLP